MSVVMFGACGFHAQSMFIPGHMDSDVVRAIFTMRVFVVREPFWRRMPSFIIAATVWLTVLSSSFTEISVPVSRRLYIRIENLPRVLLMVWEAWAGINQARSEIGERS